jgi:excisionase family DNA binding protein
MKKEKCSLEEKQREKGEEILSLSEAAEFLKVSKSCVYKLTSAKKITHFVPGGKRIYFKKSDLENWILQNRISTSSEFEANTECYLLTPKNQKSC